MEIAFSETRILSLNDTLSWDEARERAWDKKTSVFGSGLSKFFTRPKPDEVKITYQEKRWEPFWHVVCSSLYVYERTRHYHIPIPHPEVRTVTIDEQEYIPSGDSRSVTLVGVEKCREEKTVNRLIDAMNGEPKEWNHYLEFESTEIPDILEWEPPESIIVPAKVRASTITREALSTLIKPLDADTIQQDLITIENMDLYFRPIYAFEFSWTTKEKVAVAEFDGLTGKLVTDGASIREQFSKILTPDVIFDVGVDAIDLLVPGGGIAIKLAKAAVNRKK
ncbi:MAG: hypothetical protein JXA42_00840 [Anaerolineales bacterium]|nr:hypothetical protein [Anaerolineales bacterium]